MFYSHANAADYNERVIHPYVATNILYNSNLFRISDSVNPLSVTGKTKKSDFIKKLRGGVDLDWKINRQHFLLKGEANHSWYQNFDELNYVGWNTLAQWNWQAGNNLNGEIGYSNKQFLGEFTQLNRLFPNLLNLQSFFVNGGYIFHPSGKLYLGWFRDEVQYDDNSRKSSNTIQDNIDFKLQYLSPTDSSVGLRVLATFGQYPDRVFKAGSLLDNSYVRMNYLLTWQWSYSIKTQINGQIGYTNQEHDHLQNRDFSDFTGRINLTWVPTEKAQLLLSGWREIQQADDINTNFILSQGIEFIPTWRATSKIELNLPVSYERQDYLGNSSEINRVIEQQDDLWKARINLLYRLFESTTIGMNLKYEKKESNINFRSYKSVAAGLNMQIRY